VGRQRLIRPSFEIATSDWLVNRGSVNRGGLSRRLGVRRDGNHWADEEARQNLVVRHPERCSRSSSLPFLCRWALPDFHAVAHAGIARFLVACVLSCWVAPALGEPTAAASSSAGVVPTGDLLAVDASGVFVVLGNGGRVVRSLGRFFSESVQGIALAPDRRHAFVSVLGPETAPPDPGTLYELDLSTGAKRRLASAISPAVSPDGTRLAYAATAARGEITYRAALTIRNLRSGTTREIPFTTDQPLGAPPELVINWSPDGRFVAVLTRNGLVNGRLQGPPSAMRLVNVASAQSVESQPLALHSSRTLTAPTAPVFLDRRTLLVDENCCIGDQSLVSYEVGGDQPRSFSLLSSPPTSIKTLSHEQIVVVTALHELAVVSRGHTRVIATGIEAATP
jgi:hypothetical protein